MKKIFATLFVLSCACALTAGDPYGSTPGNQKPPEKKPAPTDKTETSAEQKDTGTLLASNSNMNTTANSDAMKQDKDKKDKEKQEGKKGMTEPAAAAKDSLA